MDRKQLLDKIKDGMEKSIQSLQNDLQKMRTGRASPALLNDVRVDSYGTQMGLSKVATIATPEPRLITVNPFDKSMLSAIEKAILIAGLGLTPNNDGKLIRIPIPALTEERRKDIAKQVKKAAEEAKVTVRHHRQEGNAKSKAAQKEHGWSEDEVKKSNDEIQKLTDTYIKKCDEIATHKEKEIMTL